MDRWESIAVGEEIIKFVKMQHIENYAAFLIYCKENNPKWFEKMCKTPNMRKYFRN